MSLPDKYIKYCDPSIFKKIKKILRQGSDKKFFEKHFVDK